MNIEDKLRMAKKNAEEIITVKELRSLLEEKKHPRAYWGFECSGLMHLGMGLVCGTKIKELLRAGFDFIIFLADWHSWINNKLGGDMDKIHVCGEYFKQCFKSIGIESDRVKFVWASDIIKDVEYWERVIRIAKSLSLQRTWRALPIMGREMSLSDIETAWVYYPCMQAADIFQMNIDVACAGMDQRKAHILAREVAEKAGWKKPVCIHTHLLPGLKAEKNERIFDENNGINLQIRTKMSKSLPGSSIFIHDEPGEIRKKIEAAYCPPRESKGNPILEIAKYVIFAEEESLEISRPKKYGGDRNFKSFEEMERQYVGGKLHPLDLKHGVANAVIKILKPAREYFHEHPKTLNKMIEMEITR